MRRCLLIAAALGVGCAGPAQPTRPGRPAPPVPQEGQGQLVQDSSPEARQPPEPSRFDRKWEAFADEAEALARTAELGAGSVKAYLERADALAKTLSELPEPEDQTQRHRVALGATVVKALRSLGDGPTGGSEELRRQSRENAARMVALVKKGLRETRKQRREDER